MPKVAPTIPNGGDVLARLRQETDAALGRVQENRTTTAEVVAEIQSLETQGAEVMSEKDDLVRAAKMRALTQTTEERVGYVQGRRASLATAVAGLETLSSGVSQKFKELTKNTPEQTARIAAAEQAITDAQAKLTKVQNSWQPSYLIPGGKVKAVTAAQTKLKEVETYLPALKLQVEEEVRDRLMNADFQELFTELSTRSMGTATILRGDVSEAEGQIKIVSARLKVCLEERQVATEAMQKLRQSVEDREAALKGEEAHLIDFTPGTEQYATQDTLIKTERAEIQKIISLRQETTVAVEVKEKFVEYHEACLKALEQLRGNLRTWIAKLELESLEQTVLFGVHLSVMKLHADEGIGTKIDGINKEAQLQSAEDVITMSRISGERQVAMFKAHPETMRRIMALKSAQAENFAKLREEFGDIYANLENRYGISPGADSSFTYDSPEARAATEAPAAA